MFLRRLALVAVAALFALPVIGCAAQRVGTRGDGKEVTEARQVAPFTSIRVRGIDAAVKVGGVLGVAVTIDQNLMPQVTTEVIGETLVVRTKDASWRGKGIVEIIVPTLRALTIEGSNNATIDGGQGDLALKIEGNGNLSWNGAAARLEATISGHGNLRLTGTAELARLSVSGSGHVKADGLTAKKAEIEVGGSGGVDVTLDGGLLASVSGPGNVVWQGSAAVELASVTGSGMIVRHHLPPRPDFAAPTTEPGPVFIWDAANDPYLAELRATWSLERLRGPTDLDTVRAVSGWVSSLWQHDGESVPKQSDPASILAEVRQGGRFRCVEYAIVVKGCLSALGIPSRVLGLMTSDVETRRSGAGHVVAEAYLRDRRAWVMVDGQWSAVPFLRGAPLSAVGLQEALASSPADVTFEGLPVSRWRSYQAWVAPYLFYFSAPRDNRTSGLDPAPGRFILVPAGADAPRVFQGKVAIEATTVRSVESVYPPVASP
jgi:hypothetical protein